MHECMSECMNMYVRMYVYVHMYPCIYVFTNVKRVCTVSSIHIFMYVCVYVYDCIYRQYMYIHMDICMSIYLYIYVCIYVRTPVPFIHAYKYVHMYVRVPLLCEREDQRLIPPFRISGIGEGQTRIFLSLASIALRWVHFLCFFMEEINGLTFPEPRLSFLTFGTLW